MFDNDYGNLIFNNVSMDSLTHSSDDFLNNGGYTKFFNSILNNSLGGLWAPTSYEGEIIFSNSFLSDDFFVNNCQIDSTFNSTILQGTIKYHATNSILITMFSPTISEVLIVYLLSISQVMEIIPVILFLMILETIIIHYRKILLRWDQVQVVIT